MKRLLVALLGAFLIAAALVWWGGARPAVTLAAPWKARRQNNRQLADSQVEARFADHRRCLYKGAKADEQDHLGFDLAVTANVPVVAANDGKVVFADFLGIYGNCAVIDHGYAVQSIYGHLSSIGVKVGGSVGTQRSRSCRSAWPGTFKPCRGLRARLRRWPRCRIPTSWLSAT